MVYRWSEHAAIRATLLLIGVSLHTIPAAGQVEARLAVAATKAWARPDRVLNPVGGTAEFAVFPMPLASVRVTLTQLWGASEYPQIYCDGYLQICAQEAATHQTSMRRLELGAAIHPRLGHSWRLEFGAGIGRTWLRGSGTSLTSGRPEGPLTASSHGLAIWTGIERRLDPAGRFGASIELHRIVGEDLHACVIDAPSPFCDRLRASSLRVGMNLRLEPWLVQTQQQHRSSP
jgi:hypothetical protein